MKYYIEANEDSSIDDGLEILEAIYAHANGSGNMKNEEMVEAIKKAGWKTDWADFKAKTGKVGEVLAKTFDNIRH